MGGLDFGPFGLLDLDREEVVELRHAIGERRRSFGDSAEYLQMLLLRVDHRLMDLAERLNQGRGRAVCIICGRRDDVSDDYLCVDAEKCGRRAHDRIRRVLASRRRDNR